MTYSMTADRFHRITEWSPRGEQGNFSPTARTNGEWCEEEVKRLEAKGRVARIETCFGIIALFGK